MSAPQVIIAHPVRTAIGSYNGTLKGVSATELGAVAIRETLRRSGLSPEKIDSVTMGNVVQAGNKMNPARQAAIGSGLPVTVPAQTVNRVCGSGAQAILTAATEILAGLGHAAIAGGMENMDRAPYLMEGGRWGYRMGPAQILDSMLTDGLNDAFSDKHSGWHTEDLVAKLGISRQAQDDFALRSQQLFADYSRAGRQKEEIVGVEIMSRKGIEVFLEDESARPDTTAQALASLKPAFRPDGTITAGNAPGLNSAASAMIVADRAFAEANGMEPLVRLAGYGVAGVEPGLFGLGPVPAICIALQRAGWSLTDVERFEINEAFAAVPLAVAQQLGLPLDIINVDGGAIAHGHPIGATGAVLTTKLAYAMKHDGLKKAIVTLCIGGGQGVALALEAC